MNDRAGTGTGGKSVAIPVFDGIVKAPESFAGFGMVAVEGFAGVEGVKVEKPISHQNGGTIGVSPRQFENLGKTILGEGFEEGAFPGGAIVVRTEKAGPVLGDGIGRQRCGSLVKLEGEISGNGREGHSREEKETFHLPKSRRSDEIARMIFAVNDGELSFFSPLGFRS